MPDNTNKKNEIIIASLGLAGVLATAVFSNYDKLFVPKADVKTEINTYVPTGDFETEFRYYFEVTGIRKMMVDMQNSMADNWTREYISEHPNEAVNEEKIKEDFKKEVKELSDVNNMIDELVPIYQKYFTVEEIQELNKIASSKAMQDMRKKSPVLMKETADLMTKMIKKTVKKYDSAPKKGSSSGS